MPRCSPGNHARKMCLLSLVVQGVDVEPEVDFDILADKTYGYSGDDITGVCRDAAMNGMRRKIMGKTPEQIRHVLQQSTKQCVTSAVKRLCIIAWGTADECT